MFTIDRSSDVSVHEQLVQQLRYLIAHQQYPPGSVLPSTRALAERIDVSFHTVRKAYQRLEEEQLVQVQRGRGYEVLEKPQRTKAERLEAGAHIMEATLKQLMGLGLPGDELEYLFQEQLELLQTGPPRLKVLVAAPGVEHAEMLAEQIGQILYRPVRSLPVASLANHPDADIVCTPYTSVRSSMQANPSADVLGMATYFSPDTLQRIAELDDHATLGLLCQYPGTIAWLTESIRHHTTYRGQIVAVTLHGDHTLTTLAQEMDLIVYTPGCARAVRRSLGDDQERALLRLHLSPESIQRVRDLLPT